MTRKQMDEVKEGLLLLLKKAIRGQSLEHDGFPVSGRVDEVLRLAVRHSVLPLVLQPVLGADNEWTEVSEARVSSARAGVIAQTRRSADLLLLLDDLSDRGLRPVIMKGVVCRQLYPVPSARPSTDEDFLIQPEQIRAYHEALTEYGFRTECPQDELESEDEVTYLHDDLKMCVEVHRYPFPRGKKAYAHLNGRLDGALERAEPVNCCGTEMLSMCPTDHILYMLFHAYKHFLHGGFGIRQVCDIALFSEKNADRIDWDSLRLACREAGIYKFCAAIYAISLRYLLGETRLSGILNRQALTETDCVPLLEDIMDSGLYGTSTMSRMHSSTLTLRAAEMAKGGKSARVSPLASLFPPLDYMRRSYPYLKKAPVLLPVAWVGRLIGYLKEKRLTSSKSNSAKMSIKLGKQRLELMKLYGIVDG